MVFQTHWELIKHLSLREIKGRYKQSFLGLFWIILNPFFQLLIMSFVFGTIIRFESLSVPFPLFLFVGLLTWGYFAGIITSGINSLVNNSSLVKQIYFPREILIISGMIAKTFDFAMSATIFVLLLIWYQQPLDWHMLLFFPILLVQILLSYGMSLFLSVLNLLYRDVQYLFSLVLMLWFYLTPIMYTVEFFPEQYRWIFQINPMAVLVNAYREVLLVPHGMPNWSSLGIGLAIAVFLTITGHMFFKRAEKVVADIV